MVDCKYVCPFEIKAKGMKIVYKNRVIYLDHFIRKEDKPTDTKGYTKELKEFSSSLLL